MYKFYINGQKIVAEVPTSVSDTIDWLTAEFRFSDDWNGLDKWAHFKNGTTTYDINLVNDKITASQHLNLGAGLWKVYLHGNAYDGDDVVQRAVTDSCMIRVKQADTLSGQPLPTVPPSATEQILAKVSNASNRADAAALSASSAQASATSAQTSASQAAASASQAANSASGKYTKPSGGIPKTDLASAVQTSLEKAESALQEHQSLEAYRTASDQDEIDNGLAEDINELVDTVEIIDNTKYEKPQGGIPSTDMTEAVQTSLGKADTALQEHQSLSAYRTSAEQDLLDADKVSDIKINGTSIVTDGVGNIPIASDYNRFGLTKCIGISSGLSLESSGSISVSPAANDKIDNRDGARRPITIGNLDYAVKSAMCDGRGADWSEAEQKACRKRIGEDKLELIEEINLTEAVNNIIRNTEPNGTAYNFKTSLVLVDIPANSGITIFYIRNQQYNSDGMAFQFPSTTNTLHASVLIDHKYGRRFVTYANAVADAGNANSATERISPRVLGRITEEATTFMNFYSSVAFPTGTKFKIYGIRA